MGREDPVNRGNEQVTEGQHECRTKDIYKQQKWVRHPHRERVTLSLIT